MDFILNSIEARVLGGLLEKSMTTPDYYPLSLVALVTACNQKSNREPVVNYDEATVLRALEMLKDKRLVVRGEASRVTKYSETLVKRHNLLGREAAILMVLLLRGPQTAGELRTRSERAHQFASMGEVEAALDEMIEAGYVGKLPRQPGHKECRYAHLLCGAPMVAALPPRPESAISEGGPDSDRLADLAGQVADLQARMAQLQAEFVRFKTQFE